MSDHESKSLISDVERLSWICWRYWVSIAGTIAIVVLIAVVASFLMPEKFGARATFFPMGMLSAQGEGLPASLANVTRQFGVDLNGPGDSTMLYGPILHSRRFAQRVMGQRYITSSGDMISLFDVLAPDMEDGTDRFLSAYDAFVDGTLRVRTDPETGISELIIIARDPVLAANIANHCVIELNMVVQEFSAMVTQGQATFIEERLEVVGAELADREGELEEFRVRNARILESPSLRLQEDRLVREVEIQQQIFLTLKRQIELTRIEASRDQARIAVLDNALPPLVRVSPNRTAIVLFAFVVALIVGLFQAVVRDHLGLRTEAGDGTKAKLV